ncbi:MAG TPA: protein kinase [Gemmataceae bacterium]|nr:protein kinase [Gemmataceae bacterium]
MTLSSPANPGPCPPLAASLAELLGQADGLSGFDLAGLARADQRRRWLRGEPVPAESYLDALPRLAACPEAAVDLIYSEFVLSEELGQAAGAEEFLARFPAHAAALRRQLTLHAALAELGPDSEFGTSAPGHATDLAAPLPEVSVTKVQSGEPSAAAAPETEDDVPAIPGYEILDRLGEGGMGVVYKARHLGLNRVVALKVIKAAYATGPGRARFQAEVEAVARLQHPNIVQVFSVGAFRGRPFCALEFVNGGSLDKALKQALPSPAAAAWLIEQLARAVAAVHALHLVHRDLKPANVLLGSGGLAHPYSEPAALTAGSGVHPAATNPAANAAGSPGPQGSRPPLAGVVPKIADFGLAKFLDGPASDLTLAGQVLGTPSYMAPEQASGRNEAVTAAVDTYALGAILYECLTGRPPFSGETMWDTLEQVVRQEPVPPRRLQPKVPRDLETVCLKCLEKEPGKRYASAADLADDCDAFLQGRPTRARPARPWGRAWRWARRHPAAVAAALALAGLLAAHEVSQTAAVRESEELTRLVTARADAQRSLTEAEAAVNTLEWGRARDRVQEALVRLGQAPGRFADDPRLTELRAHARRLGDQVGRRLTDQDRFRKLGDLHDAAAFERMMALGGPGKARALAEQALGLFGLTPGAGEPPSLEGAHLTEAQKAQVRENCCELLLGLARAEADGGQAERALRALALAERLGVSRAAYHRGRADCLARLGRGEEAAGERRRADECPLRTASDFFLSGGDLYRQGRLDEAVRHYHHALSLQPHHFGSNYALALCCLKLGPGAAAQRRDRLDAALSRLSLCIYQQPGRVWPYLLRGHAHGECGEFEAADADFTRVEAALRGEPDAALRYGLLVNRAVARVRANELSAAVADLEEAVRLRPEDYPAYVNLAEAHQGANRPDLALGQLDRAIALRPPGALAALYRTRARLHLRQGDPAAAARDLGRAAEHGAAGEAAADRAEQGRLWLQAGKPAEALAALDAALEHRPGPAAVHRLRADALARLGRHEEAVRALSRCLEQGPEGRRALAPLYLARGEWRARLGEHAGAAEDYTHALELGARGAATLAARGWAYLALDAPRLALRDFEEAAQGDPASADALGGRGHAAVRLGRYREGCRDAEEALRRGTPDARRLYRAARTFAQAAHQAASDGALPAPRARTLAAEYQGRSLELLRQALAALPPEQRASFWSKTVRRDTALNPIRTGLAFDRLERSCSPGQYVPQAP